MNKQTKRKLMGIAAPVSLVLAIALSSNVLAGPGKGPHASIKVQAVCSVAVDANKIAFLNVRTLITDKSSAGGVEALVVFNTTQAMQGVGNNRKGNKFSLIGTPVDGPLSTDDPDAVDPVGTEYTTSINLCEADLSPDANAANALVTVEITGGHKTFTAMCGDDPLTDETEGGVPIGHLDRC